MPSFTSSRSKPQVDVNKQKLEQPHRYQAGKRSRQIIVTENVIMVKVVMSCHTKCDVTEKKLNDSISHKLRNEPALYPNPPNIRINPSFTSGEHKPPLGGHKKGMRKAPPVYKLRKQATAESPHGQIRRATETTNWETKAALYVDRIRNGKASSFTRWENKCQNRTTSNPSLTSWRSNPPLNVNK